MKKRILFSLFLLSVFSLHSQNYYMSSPQGYGAVATGGGNATPVTVTTFAQLKAALPSTSTNKVILISGTIDCTYWSVLMTNVSIIGLPGARLRNLQITVGDPTTSANNSGILYIKPNSNNVIIRNIIFEGPGAYDVDGRDNLTNEGKNVWVDHCEFQDGMDGNFDNKGACDNTTISWCKFTYLKSPIAGGSGGSNDHRFSNLVGSSSTDFPTDGHYSITFQNCYWATGCKERMPRARNGELHILSCYYSVGNSGSVAIGLGGGDNNTTCYVQNTSFSNVTYPYKNYVSTDGGTVAINFSNCQNNTANVGTVSAPSYVTTPIPLNQVQSYLTDATCGAGATLQVTTAGVITPSNCAFLGVNENKIDPIKFSYTNEKLNFKLPTTFKNDVVAEIYNLNGQNIFTSKENNLNFDNSFSLNIENIPSGAYLCKLYSDTISTTLKFIKN